MIKRRSFYSFMMFLAAVLLWTVNAGAAEAKETRAVWVSFYESEGVGLKNKPESTFRRNADKMFRNIRDNGCNTVYFHVRAFDDAIWKSDNFDFSTYMGDAEPDYDPLAILVETAHKYTEAELSGILEKIADEEMSLGTVLRSKGIVASDGGEWFHFDLVPGEYEIRRGSADYTGRICVIGAGLDEAGLKQLFTGASR